MLRENDFSVFYRLLNFEQICLSKYIKIFDNAVRKIKQNVGAELKPPIVKLNVDFQFMVHSLVEIELSLKWWQKHRDCCIIARVS